MSDRVVWAGEPWIAYFDPAKLAAGIRKLGARRVVDLDGAVTNARYFAGRQDGLHVRSVGRLIVART